MSTFATDKKTHQRSDTSRPWPWLLWMISAFDMTEQPRPSWFNYRPPYNAVSWDLDSPAWH